jgi:hypothetical protein
VKMAQSVARKGAPALRIAYPIWVFSVILTPMPPLPVAPYERTSLDQPGWSGSCQYRKWPKLKTDGTYSTINCNDISY